MSDKEGFIPTWFVNSDGTVGVKIKGEVKEELITEIVRIKGLCDKYELKEHDDTEYEEVD